MISIHGNIKNLIQLSSCPNKNDYVINTKLRKIRIRGGEKEGEKRRKVSERR